MSYDYEDEILERDGGQHMSRFIFLLGQNVVSRVMFNGGITLDIALTRSGCQGCSLSPLLFVIVTRSLLMMLSALQ